MKTRDKEALQFVLESGLFRVNYETGDIETSRDTRGRPTEPPVWRSATFLSPSKKSSTRKRLWVNGRRVYANRAAWVLHHQKPLPDGFQIDHDDDDSLNDRPSNLVLMDAEGNRVKELANGKVKRFEPSLAMKAASLRGVTLSGYTIPADSQPVWFCTGGVLCLATKHNRDSDLSRRDWQGIRCLITGDGQCMA